MTVSELSERVHVENYMYTTEYRMVLIQLPCRIYYHMMDDVYACHLYDLILMYTHYDCIMWHGVGQGSVLSPTSLEKIINELLFTVRFLVMNTNRMN